MKKNFSEQIYESLKKDIIEQKIPFGRRLINRDLQTSFGVSSTPVRDAINRLYMDGLLEDISKGGAQVISFDIEKALDLNEVMAYLSGGALMATVQKGMQAAVVKTLEQCIAMQRKFCDSSKYLQYDTAFHQAFFDFSKNQRLCDMYQKHGVLWEMHIKVYHKNSKETRPQSMQQHEAICKAYQAEEYTQARYLLESHFLDAIGALKDKLDQPQDKPAPQEA